MKKYAVVLLLSIVFFLYPGSVWADYVLPYPSYMPGNSLYRVMRIVDNLKRFWYFGTIGQVKYRLSLSDKYLVEAKTLFEYNQYLLASDALSRSDTKLAGLPELLLQGKVRNEDMSQFRQLIRDAMAAHEAVIVKLRGELPKEFTWQPEKAAATTLHIDDVLTASFTLREQVSSEAASF